MFLFHYDFFSHPLEVVDSREHMLPYCPGESMRVTASPLCPLGFACHPLPTLALSLPTSPMPCVQVQSSLTGSCSISPSSGGASPIHSYREPRVWQGGTSPLVPHQQEMSCCRQSAGKGASRFPLVIHASAEPLGLLTQEPHLPRQFL